MGGQPGKPKPPGNPPNYPNDEDDEDARPPIDEPLMPIPVPAGRTATRTNGFLRSGKSYSPIAPSKWHIRFWCVDCHAPTGGIG
jgi:hypothetical protein